MMCARSNCGKTAIGRIVIRLLVTRTGRPATGYTGLPICADHAKQMTAADLITDESWEVLCERLTATGAMRPKRSLTTVGVEYFS